MLPAAAEATLTKFEQRRHVVQVDQLNTLYLKAVWNVGQIDLRVLLFGVQ
jgi:hypothetical protein